MLCLSPYATTKLIKLLGDAHDEKVCEWRDNLLQQLNLEVHINELLSDFTYIFFLYFQDATNSSIGSCSKGQGGKH